MISITIRTDNEETKKLISTFVFPGVSFYDNGTSISFSVDHKDPHYSEISTKIPELLRLDTLVEISNSNKNKQFLS